MVNQTMSTVNTEPVRFRLAVLGVNAWLVTSVIPWLLSTPPTVTAALIVVGPIIALGVGLGLLHRWRDVGAGCLLVGFPVALAGVAAALPRFGAIEPYPSVQLMVSVLSVLAFVGFAAGEISRAVKFLDATHTGFGAVSRPSLGRRRVKFQRALLFVVSVGALLISVIAPTLGTESELRAAWGDAAPEAQALIAMVGGVLGVAMVALFVAPAMRAERAPSPRRRHIGARVFAFLLIVALGGVVLWMISNATT